MNDKLKEVINDCDNEIDEIRNVLNSIDAFNRMNSYLTNYILIRTSGLLEFVYKSIIVDYFDSCNSKDAKNYINNNVMGSSSSIKYEVLCDMLKKFNEEWCRNFKNGIKSLPNANKLIDSTISLTTNRHRFAHGKNPTATFEEIVSYYNDCKEVVKIFDSSIR